MSSCNMVTLTKIKTGLEEDTITLEKLNTAIFENHEFIKFEETLDDKLKDHLLIIIMPLIDDICMLHNTKFDDLSVNMVYDSNIRMFNISVNFLISKQEDLFSPDIYNVAIEYTNKYEEKLMNSEVSDNLSISFDAVLKTEYERVISTYSKGYKED